MAVRPQSDRGVRPQHSPACWCDECDFLHRRPVVLPKDRRAFRESLERALKPALRLALRLDHDHAARLARDIAVQTAARLAVRP